MFTLHAAVITVSDSCAAGQACDKSGPLVRQLLEESSAAALGATVPRFQVTWSEVIPDERQVIVKRIRVLAGQDSREDDGASSVSGPPQPVDLIVTTGGTGISARDVTPESTLEACEGRSVWGLSYLMLQLSLQYTPMAALSRYGAGVCGSALVINLPGKPSAVQEVLPAIKPVIVHGCMLLHGHTRHGGESDVPAQEATPNVQ
jgi:molybdopterin adenylyltransferase